jgi:hydroxymethylglutaryl-CoA lyase
MKLIECPRDAMQGMSRFVPTADKIAYMQSLLAVGFDTIDAGSFVSHKSIPQMADTMQVIEGLDLSGTKSKLLVIVANLRGAEEALEYDQIEYLGFPLSLSETFQMRNTNRTINSAFTVVDQIQNLCANHNKQQVVFLSMGFGNPYGDPYNSDYILEFADKLNKLGIGIISLSDTIGTATPKVIADSFQKLTQEYRGISFGAHLHSTPDQSKAKIEAVLNSDIDRIDSAIMGFGGCPMATDDLTGNIATENVLEQLDSKILGNIDMNAFELSLKMAQGIFY